MPAKPPKKTQTRTPGAGRALVADAAAPGIPAHDGFPAVPPGYREATLFELWLWEARADWLLRGGVWSDAVRQEMEAHYAAVTGGAHSATATASTEAA